jgi:hypothetical protein
MLPEFKNLIHPEYPTRKRFIMDKSDDKEYSFGVHAFNPDDPLLRKESRRGHYDFVIFNDKFYNKHNDMLEQFDRLSNNNVDINLDINNQYIDFVFDFMYITDGRISIINVVEFEIFKLNEAKEAKIKYLIIFIKKIFGDKGFNQIIRPLIKLQAEEKGVEIIIFSK